MTTTYYVRFLGEKPAALYRIVESRRGLFAQILRAEGWKPYAEAIRFMVRGDIDASEATRDQAEEIARLMGLPFPE